jgi:uncharacterized repeat protein (TIGR01451 family)
MNAYKKMTGSLMAIAIVIGLVGPIAVSAATSPDLGSATSYAILASTYTNTTAGTNVNGDIGFTTAPAVHPGGVWTNYGSGAPYATAGINQGSALAALAAQPCTHTFPDTDVDLSSDTSHGTIGVYTPGVYCTTATRAASLGSGITLSGSGTYIFRIDGALTSAPGATVVMAGASPCDVFWTPTGATTLAANTTFIGNVIDDAGITMGANTTLTGRALAFNGTITTDTNTVNVPICSATVISARSQTLREGMIAVVKTVINDNGRTGVVSDFPLFINGASVVSGETNTFPAPANVYTVTEANSINYTSSFSGDCDINGGIGLIPGDNKLCVLTNNDIGAPVAVPPVPPLIDVVKVPSPLALPSGPGPVTYTYTLRNIGTVPVTDITMVGDTCSPIALASGDLNVNAVLEVDETWTYRCATTLSETHTNTVVATGWANGISAVDVANATVVVGELVVPPLIHITKVPNPLALSAGGGMVTYTKTVTNPGTVALSSVRVTDDMCSPVAYVSGDVNGDSRLDPSEAWTYTCQTNLTETAINTAVAIGEANGLSVRDFAIATVVVAAAVPEVVAPASAVPSLPNTGFGSSNHSLTVFAIGVGLLMMSGILTGVLLFSALRRKYTA